ncbi:ACT domain-containing protein [Propionivibrio soli]|uniref:ACT domain-containing protein n=1 Tax=Propionivibrio soli TaxID=2976531 RepID=UPI0021E7143A|nr:ACT domain-containing protein [Propionivibrio soli]
MIIKQISIFMENSAGRLADITELLADAKINLRAISVADTADFGILRMVADKPDEAVTLLKNAGFTARETDVIAVEVPDKPGALARIMGLFRDQGIDIEYLYASLEHKVNKAVIVVKVADVATGLRVLKDHGPNTAPSL